MAEPDCVAPGRARTFQSRRSQGPNPERPAYLNRSDQSFAWRILGEQSGPEGTVHALHLTSQVWQGHTWTHDLRVYESAGLPPSRLMLLYICGGTNDRESRPEDDALGFDLARRSGGRCAILRQVPNQPLLDDLLEDALIAETFTRHLRTGDDEWPLLFPMVKSVFRAMDALQAWAGSSRQSAVERFVVTGASKRAWTTWLAAVFDGRIGAIAPMVFDTLSILDQISYQRETWGRFSEMIDDYRRKGLLSADDNPGVPRLWRMVDPYSFRDRLELPKLIINGTNDRYWPLDALNLYWNGLSGPKHIVYVPNAGHGPAAYHEHALDGIGALCRHTRARRPFPRLEWNHFDAHDGRVSVRVSAPDVPTDAQLWSARSSCRDFREAAWDVTPMAHREGNWLGAVEPGDEEHLAVFADLTYQIDDHRYHLTTQLRLWNPEGLASPYEIPLDAAVDDWQSALLSVT